MRRPRTVLADEYALVVEGLTAIVQPDIEVVGTARDGRALVDISGKLQPDLILTEVDLPLLSGTEAIVRIRRKSPQVRVLFVTRHADRRHLTTALAAGATGYLTKHCSGDEVRTAIQEVLSGRSYISPLITADLFATVRDNLANRSAAQLTDRQREILQLIVEGHAIKEIASILRISRKTVDYHKYNLMQAIGAETNAQLLQFAISEGFETRSSGRLKLVGRTWRNEL